VYNSFGPPDVLQVEDIPAPVPVRDQVLVKVRAVALNPLDSHLMRGNPRFMRLMVGTPRNRRPGVDVAGIVQSVGENVRDFKPGDEVFGASEGALAELAISHERKLAAKPASVSFEDAAATPVAALTSLQGLRNRARLRAGQSVLIHGAAGGCGTFAVQIGKWLGVEVTAVCSARNVELVRSLGADHVIDYAHEDFTQGPPRYDVIFDFVADRTLRECYRVLKPKGLYVGAGVLGIPLTVGAIFGRPMQALRLAPFTNRKYTMLLANVNRGDLVLVGELLKTRTLASVIDRRYSLAEAVDAMRHLESKRVSGKIIFTLD
jgi:NADPH:quinone reductase-like Zn-dependent oxidoreductase